MLLYIVILFLSVVKVKNNEKNLCFFPCCTNHMLRITKQNSAAAAQTAAKVMMCRNLRIKIFKKNTAL